MGDGFDDLGDLLLGVPYQQLQYLEELYLLYFLVLVFPELFSCPFGPF